MEVRAWEVGRSEGRPVMGRIRVGASPGTKVSPRPTGASLRERMENTLNGKSKWEMEVVRPPVCAPPPLAGPELVPAMLVSQRLPRCRVQPGRVRSAFEVLEPCAGKLACTV